MSRVPAFRQAPATRATAEQRPAAQGATAQKAAAQKPAERSLESLKLRTIQREGAFTLSVPGTRRLLDFTLWSVGKRREGLAIPGDLGPTFLNDAEVRDVVKALKTAKRELKGGQASELAELIAKIQANHPKAAEAKGPASLENLTARAAKLDVKPEPFPTRAKEPISIAPAPARYVPPHAVYNPLDGQYEVKVGSQVIPVFRTDGEYSNSDFGDPSKWR